jgi:hypothetical protein
MKINSINDSIDMTYLWKDSMDKSLPMRKINAMWNLIHKSIGKIKIAGDGDVQKLLALKNGVPDIAVAVWEIIASYDKALWKKVILEWVEADPVNFYMAKENWILKKFWIKDTE